MNLFLLKFSICFISRYSFPLSLYADINSSNCSTVIPYVPDDFDDGDIIFEFSFSSNVFESLEVLLKNFFKNDWF